MLHHTRPSTGEDEDELFQNILDQKVLYPKRLATASVSIMRGVRYTTTFNPLRISGHVLHDAQKESQKLSDNLQNLANDAIRLVWSGLWVVDITFTF